MSLLARLRAWNLRRRFALSTGEFDALAQLVSADPDAVPPGDLVSKTDLRKLMDEGYAERHSRGYRLTSKGYHLWADVKQTPRRNGNWLNLF